MAGDWLKVEACTPDKPEVIGIADMLGIAPAHAFGSLFMVWRWFDQHTTEGNASYVTKVTIDRLSGNAGFADAMSKVGWLTINNDGTVALPHFDRHNGETAKQRGLTAKRVAKSKSKSNDTGNAPIVTDTVSGALPKEEKRIEDSFKNSSVTNVTGGEPPKITDPEEIIFGYGLTMLVAAGTPDKNARSFLGGLRKGYGDAALVDKLRECAKAKPLQPVEWLAAAMPPGGAASKIPKLDNFAEKNYGSEITAL